MTKQITTTFSLTRELKNAILQEQFNTGATQGEIIRRGVKLYLSQRGTLKLTDERAKYIAEREVDEAAAVGLHEFQIAWGPKPIDDENLPEFKSR